MDIFLEMLCLLAVGTQSYSFARVRGIDGCCLDLQCYTFLIFNCVRAFVSCTSVCSEEAELENECVFKSKNCERMDDGGVNSHEGHT